MMLWLLHEHHVMPGTYYKMPAGEKAVVRAFFNEIMEARRG